MRNTGIYIHIPFCKSKCNYCDFNSYAGMNEHIISYFSALNREIEQSGRLNADTVYIGGGTPTCVDVRHIIGVMENVFSSYNISEDTEITIECNPATIDYDGLKVLRECKINRLSIGLQSTDNILLKKLGRIHSFDDFKKCFSDARRAGFENISLDLMYGLPQQGMEQWKKTLKEASDFDCEHISCYSLKVEEGTPFAKMNLQLPDDDTVADMYEECVDFLDKCGYKRYEISNFAKKGRESRHNIKYWRCDDFLGLGAGAYSCMDGKRFSNCCPITDYIKAIEQNKTAITETITLSDEDKMSEFVFLGLRCRDGISIKEFELRFGQNIFDVYGMVLEKYIKLGFLVYNKERIYFSDKAFFVSNTILAEFV